MFYFEDMQGYFKRNYAEIKKKEIASRPISD